MRKSLFIQIALFLLGMTISLFAEDTKSLQIKEIKGNEGRRWAICIGINDYWDDKIADLKKAGNDAKGIAAILTTTGQFNTVYTMTDDLDQKSKDYPSRFNIEGRIDYVMSMASEKDLVVFFFSGHGVSDTDKKSFLVPVDARPDKNKLFSTCVPLDYVVNKLKEKKIKKSLLLIDACREEMAESKSVKTADFNSAIYTKAEIAAIFYATKAGSFSYEDKKSDYGIFTRFLIEGLKGAADINKDNIVSFSELEQYVMDSVLEYAINLDLEQQPYTKINEEKFGDLALTAVYSEKNEAVSGDMILVKAGMFKMGSKDSDADDDEQPVHEVQIKNDFLMGKFEVTVAEFRKFVNDSKYVTTAEKDGAYIWSDGQWELKADANWKDPYFNQADTSPVVCIDCYDIIAYCNWKSKQEGLEPCYTLNSADITWDFTKNGYRLPTEAEWEYAAKGGNKTKGFAYAGSNNPDEVAWYSENSENSTHPVGRKKPNELGLYDVSGNAWEWCWEWYDRYPGNTDVNLNYGTEYILLRGGTWARDTQFSRVSDREWNWLDVRSNAMGFRLVLTVK